VCRSLRLMVYVYRPTVHLRYVGSFLYEYMDMDTNSHVKELLFIISLWKKDKAFCLCLFDN